MKMPPTGPRPGCRVGALGRAWCFWRQNGREGGASASAEAARRFRRVARGETAFGRRGGAAGGGGGAAGRCGGVLPGPGEVEMAGKKRREPVRLVEPVSLLGLNLGDVLLGLMETGEGQPGPGPDAAAAGGGAG